MKKILISLLLIFAMLISVVGLVGCIDTDTDNGNSSTNSGNSGNTSKTEAEVGDTLTIGDLKVTFESVVEYEDTGDFAIDEADDGYVFVVLNFYIQNVGDDETFNTFYEDSYCDNVAIDTTLLFNYNTDSIFGEIKAGRAKTGHIAYEAPENWNKIEFVYDELFGKDYTFTAYKKNLTTYNPDDNSNSNDTPAPAPTSGTKVGESITIGSFNVSFTSVEEYVDNDEIKIDTPEDGKVFIVLRFSITNNGTDDETFNMFYEDSYCDGLAIDTTILFNCEGDSIFGEIAAGRSRVGYIAYEVDEDWEYIEFMYEALFGDEATFIAYSSDIN